MNSDELREALQLALKREEILRRMITYCASGSCSVRRALRDTEPKRCKDCGGNCGPECGRHPAGCIYGGTTTGYWLVVDGCFLSHGEKGKW
jgi:hypothetical protein